MMNIKVGMLPGKIEEYAVENGTTVQEVLTLAGLDSEGYEIRVDSEIAELSQALNESNRVVLLVKKIKGNMNTIKIGMLPGKIEEYSLEDETTVQEALEIAGLSSEGYEVRVNSDVKSLDYVLKESDKVLLLVKKIKGNK